MSDTSSLWTPHSVEDTLAIYRDWAERYDADVGKWGYATPGRLAALLRQSGVDPAEPVLDYGCGTGLSGVALKAAGFGIVDGTDVSPEMLERAEKRGVYRRIWQGTPGALGHIKPGDYATIVACGVVSLGAAPPETLALLLSALGPSGVLALSYNQATLDDAGYMGALEDALADGTVQKLAEEYGPHLPEKNMNSTVYILQKT